MSDLNQVVVSGRLGANVEAKYTKNGLAIVNTSLAVNRSRKNKTTDQWEQETSWLRISAFGALAERMTTLKKGDAIIVHGSLVAREYTDKDGNKKTATEIQASVCNGLRFLAGVELGTGTQRPPREHGNIVEDDIPF